MHTAFFINLFQPQPQNMKHRSSRLAKHQRLAFDTDFDIREDDLLANISAIKDGAELAVTPWDTVFDDQDDIDRLLIDTGFDTDVMPLNPQSETVAIIEGLKPDVNTPTFATSTPPLAEPVANDLPLPTATSYAQADNIISAYLAMRPTPLAEAEPEPKPHDDAPPDLNVDPASSETITLKSPEPNTTEISDAQENGFSIEKQPESGHFISGMTKTTRWDGLAANSENTDIPRSYPQPKSRINYIILAIACASLLATCLLGMMVYDMKNEVTKLSGLLAIVKEDIEIDRGALDKSPDQ